MAKVSHRPKIVDLQYCNVSDGGENVASWFVCLVLLLHRVRSQPSIQNSKLFPNFFQTNFKNFQTHSCRKNKCKSLLHDCLLHYEYNQGVVKSSLVPLPSTNSTRCVVMISPSAARAPKICRGIYTTRVTLRKFKSASSGGFNGMFT